MNDRIEKKIQLKAPRSRVWRAIADAKEFGIWFGMDVDAPFEEGARVRGVIRPTQVDPEIAKEQEPYAGQAFDLWIERVQPESLLSFRWHPGAIDPAIDYSAEPTTLVEFKLEDTKEGTLLTVVEWGFDRIPVARRAKAFADNEGGWEAQMHLVEKYLART